MSTSLIEEIKQTLENFEVIQRHSYFQLKYFLIGKEPTTQSKMWQCLTELNTRLESLEAIKMEIEEGKDNIELLNIEIEEINHWKTSENIFSERRNQILLNKKNRNKVLAEKNLCKLFEKQKYLEEEAKFFIEAFKSLEKLEKVKPFDDLDAQKEYWGEKLLQKMNLKMLMKNPVDTELIETILALPDDIPIKSQTVKTLDLKHEKLIKSNEQNENLIKTLMEQNGK